MTQDGLGCHLVIEALSGVQTGEGLRDILLAFAQGYRKLDLLLELLGVNLLAHLSLRFIIKQFKPVSFIK